MSGRTGRFSRRLPGLALALATALGTPLVSGVAAAAEQMTSAMAYVINLESSTKPLAADARTVQGLGDHKLYVTQVEVRGVTWYRLRLGFFDNKSDAEAALSDLAKQYPDAWIAKASRAEAESAPPAPAVRPTPVPPLAAPPVGSGDTAALSELMREARDSMLVGDYSRAIRLYTKVLETSGHAHSQEAQELLGLARERNGQRAHAKAEYETYLRLYPEGEGADRVKQRLVGLITASEAAPQALRTAKSEDEGGGKWEGFGSVSQYYRWDESTEAGVTSTDQSSLATDLDYTARRRGKTYDVRTRFTGQYISDFTEDEDDEGRISTLYIEALHTGQGLSGIFGRLSRSDSGILGRFDGAIVSQPLSPQYRVNLAAGLPVEFGSEDRINEHKQFYGISLDAGTFKGAWDFNTYYIRQDVDGISDREAIGGEVRYAQDGRSLFTLLDYDISYSTINTLLALAGWAQPDGTSVNVILDYRKTPVLTTSNALISQTATTVDELLETMEESELRQLAEDRTALSRSATISATRPLTEKLQIMGDVTFSSISGTPASGGVEAMEGTGRETYYSVQLIANDLLGRNDTTIFGTRYADAQNADTTSFSVNHRYPVNERLYLNPKLRFDLRTSDNSGDETTLAAALRVNHQYRRDLALEAEVGGEWSDRNQDTGDTTRDSRFVFLGFRKDF